MAAVVDDLISEMAGKTSPLGIVNVDGPDWTGVPPPGGVPCAVAVSRTKPMSRSAWLTV
ncbi:hypothetical protein LUPAC06_04546 [Micromonospora saelicesensis]|nr:hypothetical protein LUPAC06_04546 [Micromonospora saelicesensis]